MSNTTIVTDQTEELTALNTSAADSRLILLRSAAQLFAKHGYKGTTMEMVARHSQIKKQTIFYHISNKTLLCEMTLDWFIQDVESKLSTIISDKENDLVTKVDHFQQTLQSLLLMYEGHYLPLALVTELALQGIIRNHYECFCDALSDLRHLFCQTRDEELIQKMALQLFGLFGIARLLQPLEIKRFLNQIMSQIVDT